MPMLCIGVGIGLIISALLFRFYKHKIISRKNISCSENKFFTLVENAKDIIYYCKVKPELEYVYINPILDEFFGQGATKKIYKDPNVGFDKIHPDDMDILNRKFQGLIDFEKPIIQRWKNEQGGYMWFEEYATPVYVNGEMVAIEGVVRNIDEKVKLQQKLEYKVFHDGATGIYSREFFQNNIERYDKLVNVPIGIILCDLDELKFTNDNYGHKKGDILIKESTKLLNKFSRENVIVSRIGGDEFAILIINTSEKFVINTINSISEETERYNSISDDIEIKMSKGYSFSSISIGSMGRLFTIADRNMYLDKISRKKTGNRYIHNLLKINF